MSNGYDPTTQANLELGYESGPQMTFDGRFVDQEADLPSARDPSGTSTWDFQFSDLGKFLRGIGLDTSGGNALKSLGSLFTGKSDYGPLGQFAAFGGIAALLNKMMGDQQQKPVGYQGGIPKFTYERTQTPLAEQRPTTTGPDGKVIPYRPGQGGISYFTPGAFKYAGYEPKNAQEFLTAPATTGGGSTGGGSGGDSGVVTLPGSDMIRDGYTTVITNAAGGYMPGGIAMLAKGRYLKGDGDGVSDSLPARFAGSGQEARLADGEFVIPARVVSELGNGSSDAGARKLYAMLDRVEAQARKAKRGKPSGADRELKKLA
jgi:hypothetical protein